MDGEGHYHSNGRDGKRKAPAAASGPRKSGRNSSNQQRHDGHKTLQHWSSYGDAVMKNKGESLKEKYSPSSHGDHVLLFQDDMTGRKKVNASALRFVLDIIQDEAGKALKNVAADLTGKDEKDERRRVQVRSRSHVNVILAEVRRVSAEVKVPERYVKVEDSLTAVDLGKMNALRRHEIEINDDIDTKLEEDLTDERQELSAVQERKEELLKQVLAEKKMTYISGSDSLNSTGSNSTAAIHHALFEETSSHLSQERDDHIPRIVSSKNNGKRAEAVSKCINCTTQRSLSKPGSSGIMQRLVEDLCLCYDDT